MTGPESVELPGGLWEAAEVPEDAVGAGNQLAEYNDSGTVMGVPVEESARGLKIPDEETLLSAFRLVRRPRSLMVSADPAKGSCEAYDALLDRVYAGEAEIVSEDRQFDARSGRFVAWVRYDELAQVLRTRFQYLRED